MANALIAKASQVRSTLADLCARNTPASIHCGQREVDFQTARVRFLALEEDAICTDKPQNIDEKIALHAGQAITVLFVQGGDRWAFESQVQKTTHIVRLNAKHRVVGMTIRIPTELRIQQRRRNFRVSIVSTGIACTAIPESERFEYACEIGTARFKCTIVNLSVRGILLIVENDPKHRFAFGQRLFLDFRLPDSEEEFFLLAEVRFARETRGRDNTLVGLRFLPMPSSDEQVLRKKLALFVAEEQRRKLRRRR